MEKYNKLATCIVFFIAGLLLLIPSGCIHEASQKPIYKQKENGQTISQEEIRQAVISAIDPDQLYSLYKSGNLPSVYVSKFFEGIEETALKEFGGSNQVEIIGYTDPNSWAYWLFYTSIGFFGISLLFLLASSSVYDSVVSYLEARAERKREVTKEQIKLLKSIEKSYKSIGEI